MAENVRRPVGLVYDALRNGLIAEVAKTDTLAEAIQPIAESNGFALKEEFHITLIGYTTGSRILAALELLGSTAQHNYEQLLREVQNKERWSFFPKQEVWHIEEDFRNPTPDTPDSKIGEHREAYIQTVEVPELKGFYARISRICSLPLMVRPTHITLSTKGNNPILSKRGIGVDTEEEFAALNPRKIEIQL